jgi:hypothetical protein
MTEEIERLYKVTITKEYEVDLYIWGTAESVAADAEELKDTRENWDGASPDYITWTPHPVEKPDYEDEGVWTGGPQGEWIFDYRAWRERQEEAAQAEAMARPDPNQLSILEDE